MASASRQRSGPRARVRFARTRRLSSAECLKMYGRRSFAFPRSRKKLYLAPFGAGWVSCTDLECGQMAGIFSYKCATCSRIHEGSPGYGFAAPWHYHVLSEDQRVNIAKLSEDACVIK